MAFLLSPSEKFHKLKCNGCMNIKNFTFLLFLLVPLFLKASSEEQVSYDTRQGIHINNRVLASVNGKVISVIDIMKKMDMVLYQHYPQYLESPEARCQFYQMHWKQMLSDLIDRELVIADAEEKNFPISSGDVREELEEIFGPNMMMNLEGAGLSLSEVWEIVKTDILFRRMLYYQVQSRVHPQITPQDVRVRYDEYVAELKEHSECVWKAISIRATGQEQSVALGAAAHRLLTEEKESLDSLQEKLGSHALWDDSVTVTISPLYSQKRKEISEALMELFCSMQEGSYSVPLLQPSRGDRAPVVRIYYVEQLPKDVVPPIQEVEGQLRDEIIQELITQKTADYFTSLRTHYRVSKEQMEELLPTNFQPFEFQQ